MIIRRFYRTYSFFFDMTSKTISSIRQYQYLQYELIVRCISHGEIMVTTSLIFIFVAVLAFGTSVVLPRDWFLLFLTENCKHLIRKSYFYVQSQKLNVLYVLILQIFWEKDLNRARARLFVCEFIPRFNSKNIN